MTISGRYRPVVDRVCCTEPGSETSRKEACEEIVCSVNEGGITILDLVGMHQDD